METNLKVGDLVVFPDLRNVRYYYDYNSTRAQGAGAIKTNPALRTLILQSTSESLVLLKRDGVTGIELPQNSLDWRFADRVDIMESIPLEFRVFLIRCFVVTKNYNGNNTNVSIDLNDLSALGVNISRSGNGDIDPDVGLVAKSPSDIYSYRPDHEKIFNIKDSMKQKDLIKLLRISKFTR